VNARYLVLIAVLLILAGLTIRVRSTLTPERGVDHMFYGSLSDFMSQEAAVGDFNGDGKADIVTTAMWDDPTTCGATESSQVNPCTLGWTYWTATKDGATKYICRFAEGIERDKQEEYWKDCGWDLTPHDVPCVPCNDVCVKCIYARWEQEDKGAAYIFDGGDWSGKPFKVNLADGSGADHMVVGNAGKDKIYNGVAAGDVTVDACDCDELVLGAPQETSGGVSYGPGEVYVIGGTRPWPAMSTKITPPNDNRVDHYFRGRDANDCFGKGVAVGDLDGDGDAEVVVAAPLGDGPNNSLDNSGEIYIFYSNASLPEEVDLSEFTDTDFYSEYSGEAAAYAQVIWGAAAHDSTGVTKLQERHEVHFHLSPHYGDYEPVGLAIGDWNGDDVNDLAIGAGSANGGDGEIYIIYGEDVNSPSRKLRPGNPIRLYRRLGQPDAVDVKIMGKDGSHLGAGIIFADLDHEGRPSEGDGKDDLVMGAPYAEKGTEGLYRYFGEVYVAWGDDTPPADSMLVWNPAHIDVTIRGQQEDDQLGGHFGGNEDIDGDGVNDLGIAGQDVSFVLFGQERNEWPSSIDLETDSTDPELRILKWSSYPAPNSMTIEFLDLDDNGQGDLVFGGYDNEGYPGGTAGANHAGQMWVVKTLWKRGAITDDQAWSGNVFVDGDIVVDEDATLTIAAGTTVWLWPDDIGGNLGSDAARVEILVENGTLNVGAADADSVVFQAWDPEHTHTNANDKWFGIWIDDGCSATIENTVIRNALRGIQAQSSMTLKNSKIQDCKYVGITIAGDSTNVDSVYVENTDIRRIGRTIGGIGVNALGKKAAIRLNNCVIDSCGIGIWCNTKAKVYTGGGGSGTKIRHMTTNAVKVNNRASATLFNSILELNGLAALRVYNASEVIATACTFRTSDYGADITSEGGSPSYGTFTSCTFTSNGVGLRVVSGSEATIAASQFTDDDDGIYGLAASVQVSGTTFDSDFNAAYLDDGAGADFTSCIVGSNDGGDGVELLGGSYVGLINSRIWHNSTGVRVQEASFTSLDNCSGTCPSICANGNSFKNNVRHVRNLNSSGTIDAECNYWGASPPDPASFINSVDYTPYLTSDPTDELMIFTLPSNLPKVFRMAQNYPNPFNPVTSIAYDVPAPGGHVQIRIYNVSGQLVRTLVDELKAAGQYEASWQGVNDNGNPVASGVYFARMVAPHFNATRKLLLLK
jgi:hypothetical protein